MSALIRSMWPARWLAVTCLAGLCGNAGPRALQGLVVLAAHLPAASVHPPPTVYLEVDVLATNVQIDVVGELQVWNAWLGLEVSGEYLLSDADVARIRERATAFFAARNRIAIDGQQRQPVVADVIPPTDFVPGRNIPGIRIRLHVAVDQEPRTVGFVWETFEQTDLFEKKAVPAMVRYRGDVEQAVMTPSEPEYLWHTRVVLRRPPRVDSVTTAPPRATRVSVPATVLLLLGVGCAALVGRRRWPVSARWAVLGAAVAGAIGLRHVGTVRLPGTGLAMPGTQEAFAIFQRLHGNVYRAFEATSPEAIYDLLAVSVAPELLDALYADVYESLVLRGQGGAVCKVDSVEIFEHAVQTVPAAGDDVPCFGVACAWRVRGVVSHWGHEHRRLNQYRALYTVAHDGRAWRIAQVEVKEQQRIDENG